MMLAELANQVAPLFPPSARKDLKTSIKALAHALEYPDASACPMEAYHLPLPSLYTRLETFLAAQGKSPHTIRNTKNNLSRLFRLADQHHLLGLKPPTPQPTFPLGRWSYTPIRPEMAALMVNGKPYNSILVLSYKDWPASLVEAYHTFEAWATLPYVPDRDASLRKRPVTVGAYFHFFEQFFGYIVHIRHESPE